MWVRVRESTLHVSIVRMFLPFHTRSLLRAHFLIGQYSLVLLEQGINQMFPKWIPAFAGMTRRAFAGTTA